MILKNKGGVFVMFFDNIFKIGGKFFQIVIRNEDG
jgi:hypothetical protein